MNNFWKIRPMGESSKNWLLANLRQRKHSFPLQFISPTTSLISILKEFTGEKIHTERTEENIYNDE